MTIGHAELKTSTSAKSLGVWFDRNMQFHTNITKMCGMGHFYLYNIRRIRKHLTYKSTCALTHATIIARLDYCNCLLYVCSDGQIKKLKDGAYYCYCAYVLRISRYSDFLSPMLTNTGIFLRGLKLTGESRS